MNQENLAATAPEGAQRHWRCELDADGIAWLCFDMAGASTNVLSYAVMEQLNDELAELEASQPRAVVIWSAKKSGFIAGADINEFTRLTNPDEAYELVRNGQRVLDRLEALPVPTIAMINGFALGGGLELALACDYRIVVDSAKAKLGLPEVMLGIHPGFGGTVRATRLIGPLAAIPMMLTGRPMRPQQARKAGLVDQVVPARHLRRAAHLLAMKPPGPRKPGAKIKLLNSKPLRILLAGQMEKQTAKKARKEHYPAPYAIIDLWKNYAGDADLMYEKEARSIAELMCTPTSRNLVRVFQLQDRMKGMARGIDFKPRHVHVVGAGVMGGDIAAWCALRGLTVSLQDREAKYIAPAIKRAHKLFAKKLRRPALIQAAMDRLLPDVDGDGVASADVIIEAIYENLEAKQKLFLDLAAKAKPDAVLATNTSSIKLEDIGSALPDPNRLIGLHFFNPVAKLPLVEVIRAAATNAGDVEKGIAFARVIDKLPLPCRSAPGFVVNRLLFPYMIEAMHIAEEGVPLPAIDQAAVRFGMPMGPVELADTVGLDVAFGVAKVFHDAFGMKIPDKLGAMVEKKQLGRKTGSGLYAYKNGKPVKEMDSNYRAPDGLSDRLLLPLVNEAVACLREGIVEDADLLDAGVIFGTGFAPFTGGPLNYARDRGVAGVVAALEELAVKHGDRFKPDAGWDAIG